MTDLEMNELCAQAMGLPLGGHRKPDSKDFVYNPLHNDRQAMALVKKFGVFIEKSTWPDGDRSRWLVKCDGFLHDAKDLNRAIVECVATMQQAKEKVAA